MKITLLLLINLVLIFSLAVKSEAYNITKVYSDDQNTVIKNPTLNYDDGTYKAILMMEWYGESNLISDSYPGSAIVEGQYFDTMFSTGPEDAGYDEVELRIRVTNDTLYDWTAYRFEFWDTDFSARYSSVPIWYANDNSPLTTISFDGSTLRYSGGTQAQGDSSFFTMGFALDSVPSSFGVRQIASTSAVAPEPISSILFVTGGTLLAGRRYIKRTKKA